MAEQHAVLYTPLKGHEPPLYQATALPYTKLLDVNKEAVTRPPDLVVNL